MHDCSIRVFQVDLETKQQDREHCFNHAINAKRLEVTFDALNSYYDLILGACPPCTHSLLALKWAWSSCLWLVTFKTNE